MKRPEKINTNIVRTINDGWFKLVYFHCENYLKQPKVLMFYSSNSQIKIFEAKKVFKKKFKKNKKKT